MSELLLPDGTEGAPIPAESLELEPYGGLVLVERVEESDRTLGGIVLSSKASEEVRMPRWKVIAVGGGYPLANGAWRTPDLKPGDVVCLCGSDTGRGQWFQIPAPGTVKRRLVDENCVIAKVKGPSPVGELGEGN